MALFVGACGVNRLLREQRVQLFYDLIWSRIPKAVRINNLLIIDINAELAKPALYGFYLCVRFFPQLCRHTGSHRLLDGSNRAVMDYYFLQGFILPFANEPAMPCNRPERMERSTTTATEEPRKKSPIQQKPATNYQGST